MLLTFIGNNNQTHISHISEQNSAPEKKRAYEFWGWAGPSDRQIADYQRKKAVAKEYISDSERLILEQIENTKKLIIQDKK